MLHTLLTLALAASPEADLLSIASIQEMDQARCPEAMESYRRFFEVCVGCELADYGALRFEAAVARCSPERPKNLFSHAFAAQTSARELAALLRRATAIDPAAARDLYLRSVPAIAANDVPSMNAIRLGLFQIIERAAPTSSEMIALIDRIRSLDGDEARAIEIALSTPGTLNDPDQMRRLRRRAFDLLMLRSGTPIALDETQCHVTNEYGYLTINAKPWGKVYINGELAGETPISRKKIHAGCAEIRVVSEEKNKEKTANIIVRPNIVQIFSFDLEKE